MEVYYISKYYSSSANTVLHLAHLVFDPQLENLSAAHLQVTDGKNE